MSCDANSPISEREHSLKQNDAVVEVFPPQLSDLQRHVLRLLDVPMERYLAVP